MNTSVIRQMFQYIDDADWERLSRCFHPDASYERPGLSPLLGRDRLMHFYREERAIAESRHDVEGLLEDVSQGAAWGEMAGKTFDGEPLALRFAEVYSFTDGVIRTRRTYFFASMT